MASKPQSLSAYAFAVQLPCLMSRLLHDKSLIILAIFLHPADAGVVRGRRERPTILQQEEANDAADTIHATIDGGVRGVHRAVADGRVPPSRSVAPGRWHGFLLRQG